MYKGLRSQGDVIRRELRRRRQVLHLEKRSAVKFSRKEVQAWQFSSRQEAFHRINYYLRTNRIGGPYVEFGSHTATTMRLAIKILGGVTFGSVYPTIEKFIAFDSFEGMPEPSRFSERWTHLRGGDNATSISEFLRLCAPRQNDILAIKGYFSTSLIAPDLDSRIVEFLTESDRLTRIGKDSNPEYPGFACVYIDVDYYESSLQALEWSVPRLQAGGVLVLDDWNLYRADPKKGQRRALDDFLKVNLIKVIPLWDTGWGGKIFSVHPA